MHYGNSLNVYLWLFYLRFVYLCYLKFLKKVDGSEHTGDTQILISRIGHINMDTLIADCQKYSLISVQVIILCFIFLIFFQNGIL